MEELNYYQKPMEYKCPVCGDTYFSYNIYKTKKEKTCYSCRFKAADAKDMINPNIDYQEIARIVRQSNHYYIYLTNGARILAQKGFVKGLYYIIPAKTTGPIEKFEAKNCMDAIRKYIHLHNLTHKNGVI